VGRASRTSAERGSVLSDRLSSDTRAALERFFEEVRLPAGSTVFEQGDGSDSLRVIETGLVDIVSEGQQGEPLALLSG
jgi:CRP-like cAMP-binding protein